MSEKKDHGPANHRAQARPPTSIRPESPSSLPSPCSPAIPRHSHWAPAARHFSCHFIKPSKALDEVGFLHLQTGKVQLPEAEQAQAVQQ